MVPLGILEREFSQTLASQPNGTTELALRRTVGGVVNDPIRRRESGYGSVVTDSLMPKRSRRTFSSCGVSVARISSWFAGARGSR